MAKVKREEIIDYVTYNEQRNKFRKRIMDIKSTRRINSGKYLTFLFENHDTIWYQIEEMMRAEQIVKEKDIQHEIDTYNEILGKKGELGCSLLIEIDDIELRNKKLKQWLELPSKLYVRLEDGTKISATYDSRQIGRDQLSSVQYIKFNTKGKIPVAVGADIPHIAELHHETQLTEDQKLALATDLEE